MKEINKLLRYKVFFVFIIVIMLIGCQQKEEDPNLNEKLTIAMIPKVIGSTYFDICAEGAREKANEIGMDFIYKGPTTADAASQVNIIQDMILNEVDIIAISPIDPAAVKPILKQAQDEGILVITYDADADVDSRQAFVNQVSKEVLGRHMMDNIAKGLGEDGKFAILTASLTAENQNAWIKWIKRQLEEKYNNMELISIIPTDEDQQKAYAQTRNLIQAHPDLEGILALSTVAVPGAARAIEALDKNGAVKLYGLALPNDIRPYIKNGATQSATLWDPRDLGELTVRISSMIYNGEEIIDGQVFEHIGPIQYDEQESMIIMGVPLDFTTENIDDFNF
ncbi:MAG: autoinducer 2 ABC transporter substrate-binding protein [Eubacteriales bacterium]